MAKIAFLVASQSPFIANVRFAQVHRRELSCQDYCFVFVRIKGNFFVEICTFLITNKLP